MPVRLHHIVIDTYDLPGLARFWTQALGWQVLSERDREIVIGPSENAPVGICFMPVTDPKTVKNRLHLDLTSSATDRDQEIDRLITLGARRVDIAVAGAEPAGDGDGGGEVGAGRGPGEDAFGARGLASRLERRGFRDGEGFVVVGGVQQRWAVADSAALDVVGPRWPTG